MTERSLFMAALEIDDPSGRSAYLDEMCAIAIEGIEATWLGDEERRALRASFEREIATIAADD